MNKKAKVATVGVPIAVLLAVLGANWDVVIDFSTTNIGQIGDINTFIENNYGVNVTEFKTMCDEGIVHEEFKKYCRLV